MKTRKLKVVLSVIAAVIFLSAAGFAFLFYNGYSGVHIDTEYIDGQIKVACVGDSITYGHGISNWNKNNYPKSLGKILGDEYCVQNFGVSGSTVQKTADKPYTKTKQYEQSLAFDSDIIILMLGSNDSKPENWKSAAEFKKQYNELIDSYISNNKSSEIYLCTPAAPFYTGGEKSGLMNFDISKNQVDEIAEIIKEIASERQLEIIDINSFTADNSQWFEKDGIHPNKNGAAAIAKEISQHIQEVQYE